MELYHKICHKVRTRKSLLSFILYFRLNAQNFLSAVHRIWCRIPRLRIAFRYCYLLFFPNAVAVCTETVHFLVALFSPSVIKGKFIFRTCANYLLSRLPIDLRGWLKSMKHDPD